MFPIRDDNPNVLVPYATYGIIVVNAIAWVLVQGMGSDPMLSRSVCQLGLIPGALLGTVPAGTEFQISRTGFCVIGNASVWYTPLTSMFLHGGWLHVIGNMWFMWVFGDNVEDSMGHVRFVVFYLLCGLAAAAVQMATNPASAAPMVGASGAIGGVMGAYIPYDHRTTSPLTSKSPSYGWITSYLLRPSVLDRAAMSRRGMLHLRSTGLPIRSRTAIGSFNSMRSGSSVSI